MVDVEQILDAALKLNEREKASLLASLIESLDPGFDEDADVAWSKEIASRIQGLDSGEAKAVPWAEARRVILEAPNDVEAD